MTTNKKIEVYKVVRILRLEGKNVMVSCFCPLDYAIVYKLNREAKPTFGKIFCFNDLDSAADFVQSNTRITEGELAILKCKTDSIFWRPSEKEPVFRIPWGATRKAECHYKDFWRSKSKWVRTHNNRSVPPGTLLVKSLTPLYIVSHT